MSDKETSSFTSKLVRTTNVPKELIDAAKEYHIDVKNLFFELVKSELYVKMPPSEGDEKPEFEEIDHDHVDVVENKELLLDKDFAIRQVYDIQLQDEPITHAFDKLDLSISGNKALTSVYAIIKPGSVIEATENTQEDLHKYFNRRKLRARILIDMWDKEMVAQVKSIAAKVQVNGSYTFEEETRILVSQSLNSTPTIDDSIRLHFEEKKNANAKGDRVDHKNRGFITAVEENEVLITYTKPVMGTNGRNCRGEFVEAKEPLTTHAPNFGIDEETIEVRESDDKIEYIAKKNGYIELDGTTYLIKEELEVGEISFKSTGNVSAGTQGDIAVRVKESDSLKDAIGMGVEVEVKEIDVEGNVGSSSKVTAQRINIGGQTHQTSSLFAREISVNVHRGLAKGSTIEIKRLEQGGKVIGEDITVLQASGGEIYGKNIKIDTLVSHCKVYASKSIEIHKMKGSENILAIDQTRIDGNDNALKELDKSIDEARIAINVAKNELDEQLQILEEHKDTITLIKKRLETFKKNKTPMPTTFLKKYKAFQKMQNEALLLKKEHRLRQEMHETLKKRRAEFQEEVLNAKIVNYDMWKGHNEVKFKLTYPDIELTQVPKEGNKETYYKLKYDEDEQKYSIIEHQL